MDKYIIKKVLNNNVVIATQNDSDVILVGKGIGFNSKKGGIVPNDRIENIFVKTSPETLNNYNKILNTVDSEIVGICEEIISMCEKSLEVKLREAIHVSLPDHVNFAIRRIEKGMKMENPFLNELRALYSREYNLASEAVSMINNRLNINLPEDEIGFICLHIKAAASYENVSAPLSYTKKIGEIMDLICTLLKKDLCKNSLEYARTVTHIKFLLERCIQNKSIKNHLLESIKSSLYTEYNIALKVALKIENLFSVKVSEDEIGYITLHLKRLSEV